MPAGGQSGPGPRLTALARVLDRFARVPADVRAAAPVEPGERYLDWAGSPPAVATTWGIRLPDGRRLEWDHIDLASWQPPTLTLRPAGGEPSASLRLPEPRGLPAVVRARVELAVAFSRRESLLPLPGTVRLVGRRSPRTGEVRWDTVFDGEADPADPRVRARAAELVLAARQELTG